jgi:DNA-binding response OmpR family regulator
MPDAIPRIMIVEDEFLIRLTLAEALSDEGFEVIQAATADEALAALRDNPDIALLLTDIQLPGRLNGVELVRTVRQQVPRLPVIFMTGRPDSLTRNATAPGDVFIAKPYLPSQVCAAVRRLIGP